MSNTYNVFLDKKIIGTTQLEKADAPMGMVFGIIRFSDKNIGYDFIKEYCTRNGIELTNDYPEDKLISTRTIIGLTIMNENGIEIKGEGNQITGMDGDEYEIHIEGIPYPFYEKEFPNHVKDYENMFKKKLNQ
jgi:hypothetical protein